VHSAAKDLNKTPNRNVVLWVKKNKIFHKKQPDNIMLEVACEQGLGFDDRFTWPVAISLTLDTSNTGIRE
jgi:hypothetical protein